MRELEDSDEYTIAASVCVEGDYLESARLQLPYGKQLRIRFTE